MLKKFLFVPMIAAALVILTAATAFAMGWVQEGQYWYYYDAANNKVVNSWQPGNDGEYRYLDYNGRMATNTWVEDNYYVDADGKMLVSKWAQLNDGGNPYWFYFTETGKKAKDGWKNIGNNYYHFDDMGHMETGWILDNMYYCDLNDGHMVTGWKKLADPDDQYYESDNKVTETSHWYYFASSGKKVCPGESSADFIEKKIDSNRYCFDQYGIMQTGWVKVNENASGIKAYKYYNKDNGAAQTGWLSLNPPDELSDNYERTVEWFYFSNTGVPEASATENLYASNIRKINGKRFLFNNYGTPVYGLKKVYNDDGSWTAYYFGTVEQSNVQKGKQKVTEPGGKEQVVYLFNNDGSGYTGVKKKQVFYKGKPQKADGDKYEVINIDGHNYFVNASGTVAVNKTLKWEGESYQTDDNGCLIKVNGRAYTGTGRAPYEPEFED